MPNKVPRCALDDKNVRHGPSIDAVRRGPACLPHLSADRQGEVPDLTTPLMRFAVRIGVILLRYTALTASYVHPTGFAQPYPYSI